jgi:hypothetical protein
MGVGLCDEFLNAIQDHHKYLKILQIRDDCLYVSADCLINKVSAAKCLRQLTHLELFVCNDHPYTGRDFKKAVEALTTSGQLVDCSLKAREISTKQLISLTMACKAPTSFWLSSNSFQCDFPNDDFASVLQAKKSTLESLALSLYRLDRSFASYDVIGICQKLKQLELDNADFQIFRVLPKLKGLTNLCLDVKSFNIDTLIPNSVSQLKIASIQLLPYNCHAASKAASLSSLT